MEQIEMKFEKVEIKSGPRKLEDGWTVELNPEMICMYAAPETRWSRFTHWLKYLFVKGKIEKL